VSAAGVEPLRSHVQTVLAHPELTTISELQAFLGTVNFYGCFLPAAARILKPLTDLLISGHKGTELVSLADPQRAAFGQPNTPWQQPLVWHTLLKGTSSASWWTHQRNTSAVLSNSGGAQRTPDSLWDFSPGS
jgi:hypothetical protein